MWPSDAILWHRSGSTLAQVMSCCLMAPSLYLNQCWRLKSEVLWHSSVSNFTASAQATILRDGVFLTHWGLVMHNCINKLGHHWFRQWLFACSAQNHCLNQCKGSFTPTRSGSGGRSRRGWGAFSVRVCAQFQLAEAALRRHSGPAAV